MRFQLVDKIESIEPGKRIVTTKALSLAEEYLQDHFANFPVLPGVLMLEALVQSAAWLVRIEQNWSKSIIILSTARNIRYANFVQPGNILRCELNAMSITENSAKFKAVGMLENSQAVSGRIELKCFNMADKAARYADADKEIMNDLKQTFKIVKGPEALEAAGIKVDF